MWDRTAYLCNKYFVPGDIMEESRDLERVMELARSYYSLERSDHPLIEVLAYGDNHIVREIPVE